MTCMLGLDKKDMYKISKAWENTKDLRYVKYDKNMMKEY